MTVTTTDRRRVVPDAVAGPDVVDLVEAAGAPCSRSAWPVTAVGDHSWRRRGSDCYGRRCQGFALTAALDLWRRSFVRCRGGRVSPNSTIRPARLVAAAHEREAAYHERIVAAMQQPSDPDVDLHVAIAEAAHVAAEEQHRLAGDDT